MNLISDKVCIDLVEPYNNIVTDVSILLFV